MIEELYGIVHMEKDHTYHFGRAGRNNQPTTYTSLESAKRGLRYFRSYGADVTIIKLKLESFITIEE